MPNPFTMPLRTLNDGAHVQARTWESVASNEPDYIDPVVNSPLPYHGNTGERFMGNPELPHYVGQAVPGFEHAVGQPAPLSNLAPAPGSENLIAPRNAGEIGGTNELFRPHGPVKSEQSNWTGKNTALRKPVVGNHGPVTGNGGRDGATLANQAYFAQQAAYFSQQASDAAMVSAF